MSGKIDLPKGVEETMLNEMSKEKIIPKEPVKPKSYFPKPTKSRWAANADGTNRFIKRGFPDNSRSKYVPHIGKKQLAKLNNYPQPTS